MKMGVEKVLDFHIQNASQSLLSWDDFVCHKQPATVNMLQETDSDTAFIHGVCTCAQKPSNVGIVKYIKNGM